MTLIPEVLSQHHFVHLRYIDWTECNAAGLRSDAGDQSAVPWHGPFPVLECLAVKVFLSVGLFVKVNVFKLEVSKEILLV
jgi:hypothetical protein